MEKRDMVTRTIFLIYFAIYDYSFNVDAVNNH